MSLDWTVKEELDQPADLISFRNPLLRLFGAYAGDGEMQDRLTHAALLTLVDRIYAAAEDPAQWNDVLRGVSGVLQCRGAALLHHDFSSRSSVETAWSVDNEALRLYASYFGAVDPRARSESAERRSVPGQAVPDEVLIPYAEFERTEYQNDFALRYDVSRLLRITLFRDDGISSGISLLRAHRDPPFSRDDVRFAEALAPHAQRAFRIHGALIESRDGDGTAAALDLMSTAVFVMNSRGRPIHVNAAGRRVLQSRDGLSCTRDGLVAATMESTARLRSLIRAASDGGAHVSGGGAASLRRPSGKRALQLFVAPLRRRDPLGIRSEEAKVLVMVRDPEQDPTATRELLQAYYGLTPTEASVAELLARGASIEEGAACMGHTTETARWYCKQIMAKLGCRGRSELIRELSRSLTVHKNVP